MSGTASHDVLLLYIICLKITPCVSSFSLPLQSRPKLSCIWATWPFFGLCCPKLFCFWTTCLFFGLCRPKLFCFWATWPFFTPYCPELFHFWATCPPFQPMLPKILQLLGVPALSSLNPLHFIFHQSKKSTGNDSDAFSSYPSFVPQAEQNLAPGILLVPQLGQNLKTAACAGDCVGWGAA